MYLLLESNNFPRSSLVTITPVTIAAIQVSVTFERDILIDFANIANLQY